MSNDAPPDLSARDVALILAPNPVQIWLAAVASPISACILLYLTTVVVVRPHGDEDIYWHGVACGVFGSAFGLLAVVAWWMWRPWPRWMKAVSVGAFVAIWFYVCNNPMVLGPAPHGQPRNEAVNGSRMS